jgi:hypothetical protein
MTYDGIEKQSGGYFKSDILDKFYQGNGEFNYSGLISEALFLRNSLQEWNLVEMIDKTALKLGNPADDSENCS